MPFPSTLLPSRLSFIFESVHSILVRLYKRKKPLEAAAADSGPFPRWRRRTPNTPAGAALPVPRPEEGDHRRPGGFRCIRHTINIIKLIWKTFQKDDVFFILIYLV